MAPAQIAAAQAKLDYAQAHNGQAPPKTPPILHPHNISLEVGDEKKDLTAHPHHNPNVLEGVEMQAPASASAAAAAPPSAAAPPASAVAAAAPAPAAATFPALLAPAAAAAPAPADPQPDVKTPAA
jgi:hypothetical protein